MNKPITAIITVVSPPHGMGPSEKKTDFKQYFGRNSNQLILSANDNKLCLFYALELARIYHDQNIINQTKKKRAAYFERTSYKTEFRSHLKRRFAQVHFCHPITKRNRCRSQS